MDEDTICAPATPPVNSTLSIIRISGSESFRAVKSIYKHNSDFKDRIASYGSIFDKESRIDDVILVPYMSPKSFTGEDMVEIICHGNQIIVQRILKLLNRLNIRLAEPGEFSKRAFLNGKVDLTEAEAINHVIRAKSDWEVDTALSQMHGSLRDAIYRIRDKVIELKADIETGIDFIDQEIEIVSNDEGLKRSDEITELLDDLLLRCRIGEQMCHGIDVTITGKPNVGKSSILNIILNRERAIVSDIPGTTRDMIREAVEINGVQINLIDTAGIDKSENKIEKLGIEISKKNIESASIVLMVIDASTGILDADRKIFKKINKKNKIFIINKIDLADSERISEIEKELDGIIVHFSAIDGTGLKDLENGIISVLNNEYVDITNSFVADIRVLDLVEKSLDNIKKVNDLIKNNSPIEITAFEMQSLLDLLSEITGEITPDDVLNSIFSRFCIGK